MELRGKMSGTQSSSMRGSLSGAGGLRGGLSLNISNKDYNDLANKPKINGVVLEGDKDSPTLKLQGRMDTLTIAEIERILYIGG